MLYKLKAHTKSKPFKCLLLSSTGFQYSFLFTIMFWRSETTWLKLLNFTQHKYNTINSLLVYRMIQNTFKKKNKGHKLQYSLLYNWAHKVKCKAPVAKINMTQRQCYCTQHCEFMWSLSALLLMRLQLPFCFIYSSLILQHHTFLSLYYSLVTLVFSWVVLGRLDSGGWHTGSVGGEGRSGEIKRRLHVIACFCVIFCCVYSHAKSNISPVLWKNVSPPLLFA